MNRDKEKVEEDFASYYNPDPDPSSMPSFLKSFYFMCYY